MVLLSTYIPLALGQSIDPQTEMHLRFLASNELEGRKTGTQGNMVAARYIAEYFRLHGVTPLGEAGSFYQNIAFERSVPPSQGMVTIDSITLEHGSDAVILRGSEVIDGELVYAKYAWQDDSYDDFSDIDVEGKYVLALLGTPAGESVQEAFGLVRQKRSLLKEKGAKGLIEIYKGQYPWNYLVGFLNSEQTILKSPGEQDDPSFSYAMLGPEIGFNAEEFPVGRTMSVTIQEEGLVRSTVLSPNVVGWIEGSDPDLRDEYILLSAHYDHVGIGNANAQGDSINNGARDNAIGVSAVLEAAADLSANPPRRSVILAAFTGEEIGLLGSEYYAEFPPVPLDKTVFNLNCDGAGYHDTTIVAVMGLNRVGAAEEMTQAASTFGLGIFADPAPEQNLFDRSDNVNFAREGIPAPTFTPGIREFNADVQKYYHQPNDEVNSLNLSYVDRFVKAFGLAARLIADKDERPRWSVGDKYEAAFKALYGEE